MLPNAPAWFTDEQAAPVTRLLLSAVKKFNRRTEQVKSRQRVTLSKQSVPELYDFKNVDEVDFLWEIIKELSRAPYSIWCHSKGLLLADFSPEERLQLTFTDTAEAILREWFNEPRINPLELTWREYIADLPAHEAIDKSLLLALGYPGIYSPALILRGLRQIQALIKALKTTELVTWRRLSARCFAGDSKYLDSLVRQNWLLTVFPALAEKLAPRTLLLDVHLNSDASGILIIENKDTYCWLREQQQYISPAKALHLVYGRGFTSSANRARVQSAVQFSISGDYSRRSQFESQWFAGQPQEHTGFYFWGDLDYAGLAILKALRNAFPTLIAWQPAYKAMAQAVREGVGHKPACANKAGQTAPGLTGCQFADSELISAIDSAGLFLDQEWVALESLSG